MRECLVERAGVLVPRNADGSPDCVIEISPLHALDSEALAARDDLPKSVAPGERLLLDEA